MLEPCAVKVASTVLRRGLHREMGFLSDYFRHILVSALGSAGVPSQVLSASLGHQHSGTVTSYYQTVDHLSHSQSANEGVLKLTEDKT